MPGAKPGAAIYGGHSITSPCSSQHFMEKYKDHSKHIVSSEYLAVDTMHAKQENWPTLEWGVGFRDLPLEGSVPQGSDRQVDPGEGGEDVDYGGGLPCGGAQARGDPRKKLETGTLFKAGTQIMNGNGAETRRCQEWWSLVRIVVGRQESVRNLGAL